VEGFIAKAVKHLHESLPEECAARGDSAVRESARLAVEKGRRYGLDEEYDYLRFLNLMYVLGFDFDRLPWASGLLENPKIRPRRKMDMVIEAFRRPSNLPIG
jgi:hypothetical protein